MRVGRLQAGLLVLRLHRLLAAGHRAGVEISQVLPGVESVTAACFSNQQFAICFWKRDARHPDYDSRTAPPAHTTKAETRRPVLFFQCERHKSVSIVHTVRKCPDHGRLARVRIPELQRERKPPTTTTKGLTTTIVGHTRVNGTAAVNLDGQHRGAVFPRTHRGLPRTFRLCPIRDRS
uniref:Putative secreted protein n=1 Tax=Ixodes ricinus TaxID=34613 RepID=A0A6B0UZ45_IXORI